MGINYDDRLTDDSDKVRFVIGDTVDDEGPRPEDRNFSDSEISATITLEGSWRRAVAALYEVLAGEWPVHVITSFNAQSGSYSKIDPSKAYKDLAKQWRDKYGGSGESATAGLDALTVDNSGDAVSPLFQVEAFGHKRTDWDAA